MGWQEPALQAFIKEMGLELQDFEGCQVGLKVTTPGPEEGMPMRKGWTMGTNVDELKEALEERRCKGENKYAEHAKIEGNKTRSTGSYPEEMAEVMMKAFDKWAEK